MHNETKIQLSSFEQSLLKNAEWILTKNAIIEKVKLLLQQCLEKQQELIQSKNFILPGEVSSVSPKISRGENYHGLPWLMLDYPRYFDKENVFAIRTFFWWGHYFSTTVHLAGSYKKNLEEKIILNYHSLKEQSFYVCINKEEWEHHFHEDNYRLINDISMNEFQQSITEKKFIKLSVKFELDKWHEFPLLSASINKAIFEMLY
jgi:hypothetical protein